MLVFDEKDYAKKILSSKSYNTIKTQGRERCILVRYLTSLNYSEDKIRKILMSIPIAGDEYLSVRDKDSICSKIINKANEYDFITNINVKIYKEELDIIMDLEDDDLRHLLFIYLIYYKWASNVRHLKFYSKKNNVIMVVENNSDLWKLAGISKLKVADRYRLCNTLYNLGLYEISNFKNYNYIYIPFAKNDGEVVIDISKYDNLIGEILIFENPKDYKRCAVCGTVIKRTRSPKKYCQECAYKENLRKTKENKKSLKSKTS